MNNAFVVGVRLLGILILYWGLREIPTVLDAFTRLNTPWDVLAWWESGWEQHPRAPWVVATECVISLLFGSALLLCAQRFVRLFDMPDDDDAAVLTGEKDTLSLGIRLIGIYMFVRALPILLRSAFLMFPNSILGETYAVANLAFSAIEASAGGLLMFYPAWFAGFVRNREEEHDTRETCRAPESPKDTQQ